jgi:hypothetical protein
MRGRFTLMASSSRPCAHPRAVAVQPISAAALCPSHSSIRRLAAVRLASPFKIVSCRHCRSGYFPCRCAWHMHLARADRDWRMQSAIDGLFARVPTVHAVIPVNEKPGFRPPERYRPASRVGRQEAKGRAIIVPAPPRYGDRSRGALLSSRVPDESATARAPRFPGVATRTKMSRGPAGHRQPLPANGFPRPAVVHMPRSERGTGRSGPCGGDSSLPFDRTYRSSHEPVPRCLVVRGDEHHLPFRQPHRRP